MFLRWLHKSWKYFWTVVFTVLLGLIFLIGGVIGVLQFPVTKDYVAGKVESNFNKSYPSHLTIGHLDGFLPFNVQLENVTIATDFAGDSTRSDTLIRVNKVDASIDIWSLLQNKISVNGFELAGPSVKLVNGADGRYTIYKALTKQQPDTVSSSGQAKGTPLGNIEIVAPNVVIANGKIYAEEFLSDSKKVHLPDPLHVENINAHLFLELSEKQRFLDIENLSASLKKVKSGNIKVSGQIYNDERYLEFNAFNVSAGESDIRLSGEVDGVNLYQADLRGQLGLAHYNIGVSSDKLKLVDLSDVISGLPTIEEPLQFELKTDGVIDSLWVDKFSLGVGKSYLSINGLFKHLSDKDLLNYRFKIKEVSLTKRDVEVFTGKLDEQQFKVLENLRVNGKANGNADSVNVDLDLNSPYGQLALKGGTQLKDPFRYNGSLSAKRINLGPVIGAGIDTTNLNFDATANGMGTKVNDAIMEFNGTAFNSSVNNIEVDNLDLKLSLVSGFLEQEYTYRTNGQEIKGTGWIDLSKKEPPMALKGNAYNINLKSFTNNGKIPSTNLNFDYNIELQGLKRDRVRGRAKLDIKPSVIAGDSVRSHQFYMDLDSPDLDTRAFRMTSSIFDLSVKGKIVPSNIIRQTEFWNDYLNSHIKHEVLLNPADSLKGQSAYPDVDPLALNGNFKAKDLSLIKKYWPEFPNLKTDTRFDFNVNADSSHLLMSAEIRADSLSYNQSFKIKGSSAQLTASFRSDQNLKEFGSIDFKTNVSHMHTKAIDFDTLSLNMAFRKDSLHLTQKIARFSDNAHMDFALKSFLSDSSLHITIENFYLGNNRYSWVNESTPSLTYNRNDELYFENFSFKNKNEFFELKGILGPSKEDSLRYIIRNVNLERISDLINGRVTFGGKVNGRLLTRSLTTTPSVQGELDVTALKIQDRLVGDATFSSNYNPEKQRFDTQIKILTDSTKYTDYLSSNDDIGQNIVLDGYFVPPNPEAPQDSVFNFNTRFNEIDMWVLPLIIPNVFESVEGKASGKGYLRGNLDDIDFHADFQTKNVYAKPHFLKTNYFLNGHVVLDRQDGVVIDSVDVTDTKGGKGLLWGTVDLNDFKPITFLDLNFRMNNLQFLNNSFDPDVPFYGNVSGTGQVKLSGANTDLYLRSTKPVTVSEDSKLSIPLIEETELTQSSGFIQFVDSFDTKKRNPINLTEKEVRNTNVDENRLEEAIHNLTFNERFNIDLQFNAPKNVNVNLIFDPVTGEILKADGTGQLRITLRDEEVQMFGRYAITGGSYQFVSGEIFSRKLDLESGGSIVWQGDPDNAKLDISAVYRARPNISTLNYQSAASNNDTGGQRVPVDLIVEIQGTVSSVENNYYFRLPNSMDLSTNSTLSFTINQINRDEQQKLLQATSILLTGNFIPTQSYDQATTSLSQSLTRGSTVINPLLSNQVISPLLSNQVNSLLNSDVSRFDIDFNLNAYNEIDLGIALRLYNDKLILRREGQITGGGPESTFGERIGDLNATYRINKGLSVTAFHRQDQILGSVTNSSQAGDVTPSVDGLGLEAEVEFNTWKDLGRKITSTFKNIFGINKEEEEKQVSNNKTNKENE